MDLIKFGEAFKKLTPMQVSLIKHLTINFRYTGSVNYLMNLCGYSGHSGSVFKSAISGLICAEVLEDTREKYGVSGRCISILLHDDWADRLTLNSCKLRTHESGKKRDSSEKVVFESPDGIRFTADSITAFIRENPQEFKNANSARTSFCNKGQYAGWKCYPYNGFCGKDEQEMPVSGGD